MLKKPFHKIQNLILLTAAEYVLTDYISMAIWEFHVDTPKEVAKLLKRSSKKSNESL